LSSHYSDALPHLTSIVSLHDALPILKQPLHDLAEQLLHVERLGQVGKDIEQEGQALRRLHVEDAAVGDARLDRRAFLLLVGKERSEEHTSELQSPDHLVCRLLLEKK